MRFETTHMPIDTGWRVREVPRAGASPTTQLDWLPAQVPGQVHLDLERAGVIPDPYYRMYERDVAWVDDSDWVYETTFTVADPPPAHAYLRFDGLDTIAEIEINGEPLGQTDNMFIPHEFAVAGRLRGGENTLQVTLRSALRTGAERLKAWNEAGNPTTEPDWFFWGPRSFVRKAQYMYGWDWGPELVSCGIWRAVELIAVRVARLCEWKYEVAFKDDSAEVTFEAVVERAPDAEQTPLDFQVDFKWVSGRWDQSFEGMPDPASAPVPTGSGRIPVRLAVTVKSPRRWWPLLFKRPYEPADPALYDVILSVCTREAIAASREVQIGLRTVELVQQPGSDGKGQGFKFRVNGEDVFIKGANWIPADSFPARLRHEAFPPENASHYVDADGRSYSTLFRYEDEYRDRTTSLVRAAAAAGFNMLRVWGGGLYESEHFYELCDEMGILVWQDFPYACAYYPDTGGYAELAREEAVAAIRRIRNHPSLALWCGNNENQMMYFSNWGGQRPPRFLGEHIYDEVLPEAVAKEDPQTPYVPSSPYGGDDPNSPDYGDRHNWDVWHGVGDWLHYASDASRFCSEFGFASSCGMDAWRACLAPSDMWPQSPSVRWHDKTRKGYDTYFGLFTLHHVVPQTLEDLVYYTQINQAEALQYAVQHYRRNKGRCWGTLFWQINDCWPVQSWSVIDYLGVPKAAYYACRRFYSPVIVTLLKAGDEAEVHLVSDLLIPIRGAVVVTIETFDGDVLAKEEFLGSIEANGNGLVGKISLSAAAGRERDAYVYARFHAEEEGYTVGAHQGAEEQVSGWELDEEAYLFLAEPKDMRLTNPGVSFTLRQEGSQCVVALLATRFAPYVWLQVEDEGAGMDMIQLSDNFFHLRANESREVWLSRPKGLNLADVVGRVKVRTL